MRFVTGLFLIVSFVFVSCSEHALEHRFYYADGSPITNPSEIAAVQTELDSVYPDNAGKALEIRTFLLPETCLHLNPVIDSIRVELRKSLLKYNEKYAEDIQNTSDAFLMRVGIVILDNATGNIVYYNNFESETDQIAAYELRGTSRRFYGFLMTMDRGESADYDSVTYHPITKLNNDGSTEPSFFEIHDSYKMQFTHYSNAIPDYPFNAYTYAEWRNFDHKFDLNLEIHFTPHRSSPVYPVWNLMELTRTFAMMNNSGVKKSTSKVASVHDSEGRLLYETIGKTEIIAPKRTVAEFGKLLEYNRTSGMGSHVNRRLNLDDAYTIYYGGSTRVIDWLLCHSPKYTIGIVTRSGVVASNGRVNSLYSGYEHKSPRQCEPILASLLKQLNN